MRLSVAGLAVATLALIASGCGDSSNTTTRAGNSSGGLVVTTSTAPSTASRSAPAATSPVTVKVQAGDYDFTSDVTTFTVGVPYHFEVTNVGTVAHEFMIVKPMQSGMMDMEQMDAMAVGHIEEDDLGPGQTATLDLTFDQAYPAGTLEFSCHIGQHYEKGMRLPIVVAS